MNLKKISPRLYVSEQIQIGDADVAAARGFKTIVCNRPHAETPDQPDTEAIALAAENAGIKFIHIPVVGGSITDSAIAEFSEAYRNAEGPILAYCRSGMRSTSLWALVEAGRLDVNTVMWTAAEAGYDLTSLRPVLEVRAAAADRK